MDILDTHRQIVDANPARLLASWKRIQSALTYEDAELLIKKLTEKLGHEEWSVRHMLRTIDRMGTDGCAYGQLDDALSIRIGRITYYPRCASKMTCRPGDLVVFAKESTVTENPPSGEVRRWVDFIRV